MLALDVLLMCLQESTDLDGMSTALALAFQNDTLSGVVMPWPSICWRRGCFKINTTVQSLTIRNADLFSLLTVVQTFQTGGSVDRQRATAVERFASMGSLRSAEQLLRWAGLIKKVTHDAGNGITSFML